MPAPGARAPVSSRRLWVGQGWSRNPEFWHPPRSPPLLSPTGPHPTAMPQRLSGRAGGWKKGRPRTQKLENTGERERRGRPSLLPSLPPQPAPRLSHSLLPHPIPPPLPDSPTPSSPALLALSMASFETLATSDPPFGFAPALHFIPPRYPLVLVVSLVLVHSWSVLLCSSQTPGGNQLFKGQELQAGK